MGFELPSYQELQLKTRGLLASFNQLSNRYIGPTYNELYDKVKNLETSYLEKARKEHPTTWFLIPGPDVKLRLEQISCITQLAEKKLENPSSRNEENKRRSYEILLGALFYRYERLKYTHRKKYLWFSHYIGAGALKDLLEETLNLSEKNNLDSETIATCCEAYANYLLQPGATEQFAYLKSEPNFLVKLNEIVKNNSMKAAPFRVQLEFINFIKSLGEAIQKTDNMVREVLNNLTKSIDKKFAKNEDAVLKYNDLIALLNNLSPSPNALIRTIIIKDLLPPPTAKITIKGISLGDSLDESTTIPEDISEKEIDLSKNGEGMSFLDFMQEKLEIRSQFALAGAYLLTLDESNPSSVIGRTLKVALGINPKNLVDEETRGYCLQTLKDYLDLPLPEKPSLNCTAWNKESGERHLKQALEIKLGELTEGSMFTP